MPKPPPIDTNETGVGVEVKVVPNPQDTIRSPLTPVTPTTTQALASLQNVMINQAAQGLDERSKCNLQKGIQKLSKAAHLAFSNGILQRDQIRFLTKINDEAKVRRSTRADILGKAKVMGYNELEEARAKRAEQDAMKAAKGTAKRGRKRKSADAGGGEEPQAKVTRSGEE